MCVILMHKICGDLLQQPQETNMLTYLGAGSLKQPSSQGRKVTGIKLMRRIQKGVSDTGTNTAKVQKLPLKVCLQLKACLCGHVSWCVGGPRWGCRGRKDHTGRQGSVEYRFYPTDNEEPLKDFKQGCDLLIFLFWKALLSAPMMAYQEAPGWLPPREGQWVSSFPGEAPSLLPTFHLNHQVMRCWPMPCMY